MPLLLSIFGSHHKVPTQAIDEVVAVPRLASMLQCYTDRLGVIGEGARILAQAGAAGFRQS